MCEKSGLTVRALPGFEINYGRPDSIPTILLPLANELFANPRPPPSVCVYSIAPSTTTTTQLTTGFDSIRPAQPVSSVLGAKDGINTAPPSPSMAYMWDVGDPFSLLVLTFFLKKGTVFS